MTRQNTKAPPWPAPVSPRFFETAAAFRAWLEENHASASELLVGFRKVGSGLPSMTWPESVDEALCFGWIDGVRRRVDDVSYAIRFTPRRAKSNWSAVNLAKARALIAAKRMRSAGLAAYEARDVTSTGRYSFEQVHPIALAAGEVRAFRKHAAAWSYFETVAPSYRKAITHWVVSAKRPTTRARRLAELVEACAERRRLLK